jgi:iron complex transport system substrate-binding protein
VEINEMPLYAAGPGSFVADMIALAGGRNVVTGNQPYPLMSKETLLLADPQVYVIALPTGQTAAHGFTSPLNKLQAVRNKRVIALPADHLLRPTPRLALGMKVLAATLAQVQ